MSAGGWRAQQGPQEEELLQSPGTIAEITPPAVLSPAHSLSRDLINLRSLEKSNYPVQAKGNVPPYQLVNVVSEGGEEGASLLADGMLPDS